MSDNKVQFLITAKDDASKVIKDVEKNIGSMGKEANSVGKSISSFGENNKAVFQGMVGYGAVATTAVIGLGSAAVMQASKLQDLRIDLDVLTGSAEKGMKLFTDIQKAAAKTPFESADLVQTTATMLQFGVAQETVMKDMMMLGDISGGNANKLKSLGLVFGQISSAGKLTGQDLLQLINLGFNPLKAMSDKTGESMASLREKMEDGQISFDMVKQTMIDATSAGGLFFGMMDKKSATFSGVVSTLKDNVGVALAALGGFADGQVIEGGLLDVMVDGMNTLMPYLERFTARGKENPETAKNVFLVVAAISGLTLAVGALGMIIPSLVTGFTAIAGGLAFVKGAFIAVGGPVTILIALIGVLAYTIYKNRDEIKAATIMLRESLKKTFNEMREGLKARGENVKKNFTDLRNSITAFFLQTRQNIQDIFNNAINMIVQFISSSRDAISGAFSNMVGGIAGIAKSVLNGAIGIIEGFVNRAVAGLNNLIALANAVPGVSIKSIAPVSFGRLAKGGFAGEGYFGSAGGMVRGPAGIDQVPTMLSAGELVLNRAGQTNLANQLEGGSGSNKKVEIVITGNNFYGNDREFMHKIGDYLLEELKLHVGIPSF